MNGWAKRISIKLTVISEKTSCYLSLSLKKVTISAEIEIMKNEKE